MIKELVREALKNASENGYDFRGMTSLEIAADMVTFNSELEDADIDEVAKAIEAEQAANEVKSAIDSTLDNVSSVEAEVKSRDKSNTSL